MSGNITDGASCGSIDLRFTHSLLPPVFVSVFVVGLLSNIWGLRSVCSSWKKIGNINIFMLNLGVADLLYLCTLPFLVYYYVHAEHWPFGQLFCRVTRFCFNLNLYGSIGFLTCISVYRYLAFVHPQSVLWAKISSRTTVAISLLVWILVILQILPDMFFEKNDPESPNSCFDTTSNNRSREYLPYSVAWCVTGFAVPLVIILLCYGHVVVVLARNNNNNNNNNKYNSLLKQRCLKLVVILVILFSVCFIPYHVFRNVNLKIRILKQTGICHRSFSSVYVAHQVGRCLACLNSAINPLIYIVGNDAFLNRLNELSKRARRSLVGLTGAALYRKPLEQMPLHTVHTDLMKR